MSSADFPTLKSDKFGPTPIAYEGFRPKFLFVNNVLFRDPILLLPKAKAAAETLFQNGGVLTLAGDPTSRFLLGDLRWHQNVGVFLFVAFGDDERDAHYLPLDAVVEDRDGSIRFSYVGLECAKLEKIADAAVDDPDDYHIAWQLWQQVAPLRGPLIDRWYKRLIPNAAG